MERSQIYISAFPALKLPFFRELFFLVALFSTRVEMADREFENLCH